MPYFMILLAVFCFCVQGAQDVPNENLQVRLVADSIKSTTDFFIAAMPNLSNSRYAANQTNIHYRPLYIRSFIEHRAVVSLADMRGFSFGTLRAPAETIAYLGYYYGTGSDETEFRIATFNSDDVAARTEKDGFTFGVFNGMLSIHGGHGYTAAFTEFLMYSRGVSETEDAQIRNYLNRRYRIRADRRHLRANPVVVSQNLIFASNATGFDDRTLVCAALVEDTQKRISTLSVDLLRSYNQGEKWSPAIGSIIEKDGAVADLEPFIYVNLEKAIYIFYCKPSDTGGYKLALRYSDESGYRWSEEFVVSEALSNNKMRVVKSFRFGEDMFFVVNRFSQPPFLLEAKNIMQAKTFAAIDWHCYQLPIKDSDLSNFALAVYDEKLFAIYNDSNNSLWQMFTDSISGDWSTPQKVQSDGFDLYNPISMPIAIEAYQDGFMMLFRNSKQASPESKDTLWLTKSTIKNGRSNWSSPQIAVYSSEYGLDASMKINSIETFDGVVKANITCGNASYFCPIDAYKPLYILPEGVGVFELKGKYAVKPDYEIPPLPSLLSGNVILGIEISGDLLKEQRRVFTIGDDECGLSFYVRDGSLGARIADGADVVVIKTAKLEVGKKHNVVIELDGKADIVRILVDGKMSSSAEDARQSWAYLPPEIDKLKDTGMIHFAEGSHYFVNRLGLHYKTD